jgi:vacuolar-type H+-ATPase catalytic subunit A/Vma1
MKTSLNTLSLLFLSLIWLISGCSESHQVELSKIQQLEDRLDSCQQFINLDAEKLTERADLIDLDLQILKKYLKDTVTQEFGNKMDRYKQIRKIYRTYVTKQGWMRKEYSELKKQLNDLRTSVQKEEINHEQFTTYFETEKQDVSTLFEESKLRSRMVHSVEPEFIRITNLVEPIINEIRSENDVVDTMYKGVEAR